ncbi:family 43 glycosylhydrolase [Streptomyces sp. NPDC049687]|uniref:family 43 glycosylhydrolase n=1 Tax=Streptomyces sp. NPDC049687 TaxID=3365596 RepID=UPI00378AD109
MHPDPLLPHRAGPHIHRHTDGIHYFTATHPEYDRIAPRRSRTPAGLATADKSLIRRAHATGDMGAHVRAPELHHVDGARYAYFAVAAAVAADGLVDPAAWSESPVPVFRSSDSAGVYGPGHNAFTVAEDGETDVLLHHARSYRQIDGDPLNDPNPHTRIQPFGRRPDGTPDFGAPSPTP